jgi:hypothetical protein
MSPPRFLSHVVFGTIDKVAALLGATEPLHWLTIARPNSRDLRSEPVSLYEIDGRTYILDIQPSKGWTRDVKGPVQGTVTTGREDTDVTLTEVTDPAVKHQVVIATAAKKTKTLIATGEDKRRPPESIFVALRIAPDDTPEGLAAAVPRVAVFEVTPT